MRKRQRTLVITSIPSDSRIYWSLDGKTFMLMTVGNGRTPLTYTSKNWSGHFWVQVRKDEYEPSAPHQVDTADNVTLHIVLKRAIGSKQSATTPNKETQLRLHGNDH